MLRSGGGPVDISFSAGGRLRRCLRAGGDGRAAVKTTRRRGCSRLKSSGGFTTSISIGWGGTGYTAAPGDFDADGRRSRALPGVDRRWLITKSSSGYGGDHAFRRPARAGAGRLRRRHHRLCRLPVVDRRVDGADSAQAAPRATPCHAAAAPACRSAATTIATAPTSVSDPATGDWSILLSGNATPRVNKNRAARDTPIPVVMRWNSLSRRVTIGSSSLMRSSCVSRVCRGVK